MLRRVDRRAVAVLLLGIAVASCAKHIIGPAVPPIAADSLVTSIFLIGDAGSPANDDPVLIELTRQATAAPRASAIVYLGDNLYPHGLPLADDPERPEMERRLDRQIQVARQSGVRALFIPGNHDWSRMGREGWDAVRRSEIFIKARGEGLAQQAPRLGCPGPDVVDIGPAIRLVLLDTQWWLQKVGYPRANDSVSTCVEYSEEHIVQRISQVLADSGGRLVIMAAHHPLATKGEHGGHFELKAHIFPLRAIKPWLWIPLPIIGSLYPLARGQGMFGYSQDMGAKANRHMREQLTKAMTAHPPMLYAAGHDHNLQVFRGPVAKYTIVSGAGMVQHESPVGWTKATLYAATNAGFMRLDVDKRKRARLSVYALARGKFSEVMAMWLTDP